MNLYFLSEILNSSHEQQQAFAVMYENLLADVESAWRLYQLEQESQQEKVNPILEEYTVPEEAFDSSQSALPVSEAMDIEEKVVPTETRVISEAIPEIIMAIVPMHLPNASQNQKYEWSAPRNIIHADIRPECGLVWNAERQIITGIPHFSGDVVIDWFYQDNTQSQSALRDSFPASSKLYINPDPKTLWKNLPSDVNDRYYKTDQQHYAIASSQAQLLAARIRGRSHANQGSFCDDDVTIFQISPMGTSMKLSDGDIVRIYGLCVSDGAGSAEFSRYGSQLATNAAQEAMVSLCKDPNQKYVHFLQLDDQQRALIGRNLLIAAARQAYAAHYQAQEREQINLKNLASTLLIAITFPLKSGRWLTSSYWVGDGAMAVYDPALNAVKLLGVGDSGQYAGETCFLSAKEVQDEAVLWRVQQFETESMPLLLVMSDGVSDPYFETESQMFDPEAWQVLWRDLQPVLRAENPAKALEDWLHFEAKGHYDDRTLALLIPSNLFNQGFGKELSDE